MAESPTDLLKLRHCDPECRSRTKLTAAKLANNGVEHVTTTRQVWRRRGERTVRAAAQDPGVEGRLAVEPLGDMEVAVHAQPPRPLVPAPGAALFAPHGLSLLPRTTWLAALPSKMVRAQLARSAFASPPASQDLSGVRPGVSERKGTDATEYLGLVWPLPLC
jgi:hypothetical protein